MKYIRLRRFKNHPLKWKYRVHQIGRWNYAYYPFYSDAKVHARVMSKSGGEWVVYRVYPSLRLRKMVTVGGHFDDWPESW